jgi:hypothetical protein
MKLYSIGIQSKTLFLSTGEIDEERATHRWVGDVAQVRVLEMTKGPKKMHFFFFYGFVLATYS